MRYIGIRLGGKIEGTGIRSVLSIKQYHDELRYQERQAWTHSHNKYLKSFVLICKFDSTVILLLTTLWWSNWKCNKSLNLIPLNAILTDTLYVCTQHLTAAAEIVLTPFFRAEQFSLPAKFILTVNAIPPFRSEPQAAQFKSFYEMSHVTLLVNLEHIV